MVEENQRVFLLIVLHSFYPLNCIVVDKNGFFIHYSVFIG